MTNPQSAIQAANAFTTANYGFEVDVDAASHERPLMVISDTAELLTTLGTLPKEVAAAGEVDKVMLGIPEEKLFSLTNRPGTVAAYEQDSATISFGYGSTKFWSHEALGHGLEAASSKEHCGRIDTYDPNFEAVNPPGFSYRENYVTGQDPIVDRSTVKAYGASDSAEDMATVASLLVPTDPEAQATCIYNRISNIVDTKFAIAAARLEDQVPGAGELYATQLANHSCHME